MRSAHTANQNSPELDQLVIDAVWNSHEDELFDIARKASDGTVISASNSFIHNPDCRKAILTFLREAQEEVERLYYLSDNDLRAEYVTFYREKQAAPSSPRIKSLEAYAFFNMPQAQARFEHWLKLQSWTVEETTALLLRKDPTVVDSARLASDVPHNSPFAAMYADTLDRLLRTTISGRRTVTKPDELVRLAKKTGLDVPEELNHLAPGRGTKSATNSTARLNTTYTIFAALLVKKFEYDIDGTAEEEVKRVADLLVKDLHSLDCLIDPRTIRSIVKESRAVAHSKEPKMGASARRKRRQSPK